MKRTLVLFLTISIIVLSGCGKKHTKPLPWEVAEQYLETVIDCAERKDSEGIKELFCTNVKETHDLDEEIEEFFDFIDGNIISYDGLCGNDGYTEMEWGDTTLEQIYGEIEEVKTDKGKTYLIDFNGYYVYRYHEEYIGVTDIYITDKALYDEKKGDLSGRSSSEYRRNR